MHVCRCPLRYPADRVMLPALEGFALKLKLGTLTAAVQAEPALRLTVQHAADTLQALAPPAEPTDWSRSQQATYLNRTCNRLQRDCSECPAVFTFLQDAQQSQRHFELGYFQRQHLDWWVERGGALRWGRLAAHWLPPAVWLVMQLPEAEERPGR